MSTTLRPSKLLRSLLDSPTTVVRRSSTYANSANLPAAALAEFRAKYESTRVGRQELHAEVLEEVEGALWNQAMLDASRVAAAPPLVRVVVAVDPAMTSGEDADETGVIVGGKDEAGHFYVLGDYSLRGSPDTWARRVVGAYERWKADRVVLEVNAGGEMASATLRNVAPNLPLTSIHASRGKRVRAEPVAALYKQGKVHHVGSFQALADQMCVFVADAPRGSHDDRVDALVYALSELSASQGGMGLLEWYRAAYEAQQQARGRGSSGTSTLDPPGVGDRNCRTRKVANVSGNPVYWLSRNGSGASISCHGSGRRGGLVMIVRKIALLVGLMTAAVGCGPDSSNTYRGVRSDALSITNLLSDVQAQQAVYAAPCPSGPDVRQGTCVSCVAMRLNLLLAAKQIDAGQRDRLQSWFAEVGCACKPTTCTSQGKNCGNIPDGCTGGDVFCGTCGGYDTCGGGGTPNVCGCTPTTCPAGTNCGSISNGCGGTVACGGSCTLPETCGGGGTPNVCGGCTPRTCADLGRDCGSVSDHCGGTLTCGPACNGSFFTCDCNDGSEVKSCLAMFCTGGDKWIAPCDGLCGGTANYTAGNGYCQEMICLH